jgi:hypothetical protein
MWDPLLHSDEENVRWCWLRAVEWGRWPIFLSQSIAPVLLAFLSVPVVILSFVGLNLLWALVRYRFVSRRLAELGFFIVLPKMLICAGMAIYLYLQHDILKAAFALVWPALIFIIGVFPTVQIGVLQGKFMQALRLGDVWRARRDARREAFFQGMRHAVEPAQAPLVEGPQVESQSQQTTRWDEALQGVDFEAARSAVAYIFSVAADEARRQGAECYYKQEFADAAHAFMSNPCMQTAIQLLRVDASLLPAFEGSKPGGLSTG